MSPARAMQGAPRAADPRVLSAWFVTPEPGAAPTGGTLYGAALVGALQALGADVRRVSLPAALGEVPAAASRLWVDSLYLDSLPELAARAPGGVGLCLHYLPSLVEHGDAWQPHHLGDGERAALSAASAVLVPSAWLDTVLARLGPMAARRFVVEPGVDLLRVPRPPRPRNAPLRAVMVANVLPGKGVLPLLAALDAELSRETRPPPLSLTLVGRLDAEPAYAAACRERVARSAALSGSVRFTGSLSPADTQAELCGADALVSASRMESYGMALAEAVALGVPVLARRGGNASSHARAAAGGALFEDDAALASELVRHAREPGARVARSRRAWLARRHRPRRVAASDFVRGAH